MVERSARQMFVAVVCFRSAPAFLTRHAADFGDLLAFSKIFPAFLFFSPSSNELVLHATPSTDDVINRTLKLKSQFSCHESGEAEATRHNNYDLPD